jgi:hypothetical protein
VALRKNPRTKEKSSKGKSIVKLAQDLIAKKWGVIPDDKALDNMTLQQYLNLYKEPLDESSTQAIL